MRKKCIIWTICKQQLQQYLDESSTLKEVIVEKLGMRMDVPQGMHYKRLKKRIALDSLDLSRYQVNHEKYMLNKVKNLSSSIKKSNDMIFVENSQTCRSNIKIRILNEKMIEYKCSLCNCLPVWNGEELSLELDHINQINNDNRLENLRFLCPNCHSQITNKHRKKKSKIRNTLTTVCLCGKNKHYKSNKCRSCTSKRNYHDKKKFNPSSEELIIAIKNNQFNICAVGRHYGVSDNAIRKRCRSLNINWKSS